MAFLTLSEILAYNLNSFEPTKVSSGNSFEWINPQLSPLLTRNEELVKKAFIGLQTDNDVANILEIPVGQLLYILYTQKENYNSFSG